MFSTEKAEGAKDAGADGSEGGKNADGGYDTQGAEKRVGNPIQWANPMSGATMDDHSSPKWTWVYPAGLAFIVLMALYSRRKALKEEEEAAVINTPSLDMSRFSAPR